jgi:flavodoxin I
MKKTALLYWAPGGNVEKAAKEIYGYFDSGSVEMDTVAGFDVGRLDEFDQFIFGCATIGAEIWLDVRADNKWNEFFVKTENTSFAGKKFAIFGLGDQVRYPDHYVDSLGYMKEEIEKRGGLIVGKWPTKGYTFSDSEGVSEGMFYGLALDEDQQAELSSERIKQWVVLLRKEFSM